MEKTLKNIDDAKKLMNMAIYSGKLLIMYGAEIYRAEDTVQRICESMENVNNVDAYVLPSGIFVSFEFESEIITIFKKVYTSTINLGKIDELNDFSRNFVHGNIECEEAMRILKKIENESFSTELETNIAASWAAAFFSLLFGGDIYDFFVTFFVASIMSYVLNRVNNLKLSFVINNFVGAFIASISAIIFTNFNIGNNYDMIIIGTIMLLVPGVAATNAIRDILNGDFLSGMMGLTKAIFISLAIALGVGVVLKLFI